MSPVFCDFESLPEPEGLRERLDKEPENNLVRVDLAVSLFMRGEESEAREVVSCAPSPGPGRGLLSLNRFYMEAAHEARECYERQKQEDLNARIKSIDLPERQGRPPTVSVVMPTYNRVEKIRPSVESVLDQTFQDFELVIVNDGGDPAVRDVVQSFNSDKIVFVDAVHGNVTSAINVGIHCSRGKYIARLDDDDLFLPRHLERAVEKLEESEDAKALYVDHELRVQEKRDEGYVTVERREVRVPDWDLDAYRRKNFFHTTVVVAREVFDELGLYMDLPTREDWEMYLRIGSRFGFIHLPEVTVVYVIRRDRSNFSNFNRLGFIHHANVIGFLHRIYSITSSLWKPYGRVDRKVEKVIESMDRILDRGPEAVKLLDLRKLDLLESKKPYTFFLEWGRELGAHPDYKHLARYAFREALRRNPWEPKPFLELWRSRRKLGE